MNEKERRIIEELSLIRDIIKYIVPEDSGKLVRKKEEKRSRLEEEIEKSKKGKITDNFDFLEDVLSGLRKIDNKNDFLLDIRKEKDNKECMCSFIIKYQENENEQSLVVEGEDENKQKYSFEISREKAIPDKQPYQLNILYENNKREEKLEIKYNLRDYPLEREMALQDFTNQLDKTLHIMPKSIMGGVLGYTYLGENFMARRDDLTGDKALMVDVHEAIHTPDEYETRVLTEWMLSRERMRYKR